MCRGGERASFVEWEPGFAIIVPGRLLCRMRRLTTVLDNLICWKPCIFCEIMSNNEPLEMDRQAPCSRSVAQPQTNTLPLEASGVSIRPAGC